MKTSTKAYLEKWNEVPDESNDEHHDMKYQFPDTSGSSFHDPLSNSASSSSVAEFYRDRSIFITGGTGFMGRVLVEKLLRSCPGIKSIYVLLRPKKGNDVRQRLSELTGAKLFGNLKRTHPEMLKKVIAIKGDITEPDLGISQPDTQLLSQEVSVVFHSAATVRFDEPLKLAVEMNVIGTKRVMELCRKMTNLVSLIHVSTAYCNCDRDDVTETIYPLLMKPQQLIEISQWSDNELVKTVTPPIVSARPNTYTYTKAMAEYMLVEEYAELPIAVVRPSIVTSAWKEPLPGWIDNFNGPTGLFIAVGKGLARSTPCHGDFIADFIPVDIAINFMITVGWYTGSNRSETITAYNCTSGSVNPITWGDVARYLYPQMIWNPMNKVMWCPAINYGRTRLLVKLSVALEHYLPAYLLDSFAWLTGRKRRMVCIQDKLQRALQSLLYFETHEWNFSSDNLKTLWTKLQPIDQELFPFDVAQLSWKSYWETSWFGIKQFLLEDEAGNASTARKNFHNTLIVSQTFSLIKLLLAWRLLTASSGVIHRSASSALHLFSPIAEASVRKILLAVLNVKMTG